jgi:hypothetical protein
MSSSAGGSWGGRSGVLLHDRVGVGVGVGDGDGDGVGQADGGGPGGRCRSDQCSAFRGDGGNDRLLSAGEVVVIGPRRDPRSVGDVVDAHVAQPTLQGQSQGGLPECLPRSLLFPVPQPEP